MCRYLGKLPFELNFLPCCKLVATELQECNNSVASCCPRTSQFVQASGMEKKKETEGGYVSVDNGVSTVRFIATIHFSSS